MPRERTFWMVLATLVLVGLVGGFFTNRERVTPLELAPGAPRPRPQPSRERVWREARFEPVAAVPLGRDLELPTLLRVGPGGGVYVLDSGRSRVLRISPEGRILAVFGDPSLGNPTDVAVGDDGEVWVCDPDKGGIAVFSPEGRLARRIDLDPRAGRLALEPGGGFVATSFEGGEGLFRRYSGDGEPQGAFGTLFQEELHTSLAADGWIVTAGSRDSGSWIYPFRNAGLLVAYEGDGRLRYLRQTVDPVPLPSVRIDPAGRQNVVENTPVVTVSGSVVGNDLYLLNASRALDVYDAATGTYRYSLKPPEEDARYVVLAGDLLYSAGRRGVTIWTSKSRARESAIASPASVGTILPASTRSNPSSSSRLSRPEFSSSRSTP